MFAQRQCVVGIDTRQRDHDDVDTTSPTAGPAGSRVDIFCHLVFIRGPAGALLSVVASYQIKQGRYNLPCAELVRQATSHEVS
jgi:hypothetical protein